MFFANDPLVMTGAEFSRSFINIFFVATREDRWTCDIEEMKSTIGENSLRYVFLSAVLCHRTVS